MKFSCDRCGKKYATAETPASGRVYKIKCKACGHLIVVRSSAASQQAEAGELRPPTSSGMPALTPSPPGGGAHGVTLEIAAPEPAGGTASAEVAAPAAAFEPLLPEPPPTVPVPGNGAPAGFLRSLDATQEVSVGGTEAPPAPQGEGGYVDLFGGAESPRSEPAPADPLAAAALASLPDGYGKTAPAPDPFAPLRTPPPEQRPAPEVPAAKVPVIAKPAQQRSKGPILLIGLGGLVLVGILAFVLLGGPKAPPPAPPPPVAAVSAPPPVAASPAPPPAAPAVPAPAAPVAQPEPAPPPAPPPEVAAAKPEKPEKAARADEDRRSREERRAAEREAKAARAREKAAREQKAREEKAAREAKAREEREARQRDRARQEQEKVAAAGLGEAEGGLGQDQVQKVLNSTRKAFESCIASAGKSGAVALDGRKVSLRLNIQTNGAVTYPTLDDVTLNSTDLGSCLKSAARLMVFPKFKGDTMHVEVPLVLAGK